MTRTALVVNDNLEIGGPSKHQISLTCVTDSEHSRSAVTLVFAGGQDDVGVVGHQLEQFLFRLKGRLGQEGRAVDVREHPRLRGDEW